METIRISLTLEQDGEIHVSGLPWKRGQRIEMIVLPDADQIERPALTADRLLASGVIGIWRDRDDLGDSADYARELREQAQRRGLEP
jgi:hypothetical protein